MRICNQYSSANFFVSAGHQTCDLLHSKQVHNHTNHVSPSVFLQENPCQHPVVILKDINYEDIEAVLCFVYQGTVYISKSRMDSFLKTAESLQIKGLAGASNMMGDNEVNIRDGLYFLTWVYMIFFFFFT